MVLKTNPPAQEMIGEAMIMSIPTCIIFRKIAETVIIFLHNFLLNELKLCEYLMIAIWKFH